MKDETKGSIIVAFIIIAMCVITLLRGCMPPTNPKNEEKDDERTEGVVR
jgi:hypothetical protein